MRERWLRPANLLLSLLFVAAAILQYNDPDAALWMATYAAAALVSGWTVVRPGRAPWWLVAGVGILTLIWGLGLLGRIWGRVGFAEMFSSFEMKSPEVEVAREAWGLLLVAGGMALALLSGPRRTSR